MSYLLAQILVCLLIAGLIGAVIGWLLRGGCASKLRDCEDEYKMKMGTLESEWNSKLLRQSSDYNQIPNQEMQAATLKRHAQHVQTHSPSYSYTDELKEGLNPNILNLTKIKELLVSKNISLSDEKIKLYAENGVNFEETNNLEDNYQIESIEGIGPTYAKGLQEMEIKTTQDLVNKLQNNHEAADEIANTLNIQPSVLLAWTSMADLMRLPGLDAQAAEIIQAVGITTTTELGITHADSLHNDILTFNTRSPIVSEVPTIESLSLWSKIAKLLG